MSTAPSSAWEDLRTAATVVVMRAEQVRNGRPMPPEIAALERALEEIGAAGVMEAQAPRWHEPTLQAVLRGLRSEEQTVQIRAAIASVEAMLSDGVPGTLKGNDHG